MVWVWVSVWFRVRVRVRIRVWVRVLFRLWVKVWIRVRVRGIKRRGGGGKSRTPFQLLAISIFVTFGVDYLRPLK